MKYVCAICGYVYDAAEYGGTPFDQQDDSFFCPICGAKKEDFVASDN